MVRRFLQVGSVLLFGFAVGVLFQKLYGAGTLLRLARGMVTSARPASAASTAPAMPDLFGLPDEYRGKLSLFVLAGQSNMSGRGDLPPSQPTHSRVFTFGNDYRWKLAEEPVDSPEGQVDLVSEDAGGDPAGFSPGLRFALSLVEQSPDLAIGLIPCAKGNTTITQWRRSLSDATLYGSCLKRVRAASLEGAVKGMLFFQGEADALDPVRYAHRDTAAAEWAARFSSLVDALRDDVGVPSLPVVFAQIGSHAAPRSFTNWDVVRQQQRAVERPCVTMITTDDLPLKDGVHFTTESYRVIGQRFADAYLRVIGSEGCA